MVVSSRCPIQQRSLDRPVSVITLVDVLDDPASAVLVEKPAADGVLDDASPPVDYVQSEQAMLGRLVTLAAVFSPRPTWRVADDGMRPSVSPCVPADTPQFDAWPQLPVRR